MNNLVNMRLLSSTQEEAFEYTKDIIHFSQNEILFERFNIVNNKDNRFEMICLGCFIVFCQRGVDFSKPLRREISDQVFYYLEESFLQKGFTSAQLSKELDKLSKIYYARLHYYSEYYGIKDKKASKQALASFIRDCFVFSIDDSSQTSDLMARCIQDKEFC